MPWVLISGFFTAFGLLLFIHKYLDDLANGRRGTLSIHLIQEMAAACAAGLLFPFILRFVRGYKLDRGNWRRRLPLHLLALVGFSVAHTTLNGLLRSLLFPLAGLGAYHYGILLIRYPMEFANVAIFYFLFVVIIHLFDYYRSGRERELKTAQLEAKLAGARLESLRLQLQPHFLFNALNTISAVVYEDAERADRMIARLSDLLRLTLTKSRAQEVTLTEELEYLNLYLEIMRARFEERLAVRIDVRPGTEEALVPQLILQPLVENSIKHAADPRSGQVAINVHARREAGSLWLEISDNGPGLQSDPAALPPDGIGLSNTTERLRQLYGAAQSLTTAGCAGGGLTVRVKMPFHTADARGRRTGEL
jgi:two-component system LytT family sensor kinase